jgi:hypothetical protein
MFSYNQNWKIVALNVLKTEGECPLNPATPSPRKFTHLTRICQRQPRGYRLSRRDVTKFEFCFTNQCVGVLVACVHVESKRALCKLTGFEPTQELLLVARAVCFSVYLQKNVVKSD